tara:strand:- start:4 stop:711 length:708 start_codon:yes stop_codon:yes gene_type:complete
MNKADAEAVASLFIEDDATSDMRSDTQNGLVTIICLTLMDWTGMVLGSPKTMARIAEKHIPVTLSLGAATGEAYAQSICGAVCTAHHRTTTHYVGFKEWTKHRVAKLWEMLSDPVEFSAQLVNDHTIRLPIDPNTGTGEQLARFDIIKDYVSSLNNKHCGKAVAKGREVKPLADLLLGDHIKSAYKDDYANVSVKDYLTAGKPALKLQGDADPIDMEAKAGNLRDALAAIRAKNT